MLAPGLVTTQTQLPIARVLGCSNFATSTCYNETLLFMYDVDFPRTRDRRIVYLDYKEYNTSFEVQTYPPTAVSKIFPMYSKADVLCIRNRIGLTNVRYRIIESCLLTSETDNQDTLIERWEYDRRNGTLLRHFPGPIFQGRLRMADQQKALVLQNLGTTFNWESFSSVIVADGVVYQANKTYVERLTQVGLVTSLPWPSVIAAISVTVLCIFFRIIIYFYFGKDGRPQINTIDGLSSVAREEHQPTGRSMQSGQVLKLGVVNERNPNGQELRQRIRPV